MRQVIFLICVVFSVQAAHAATLEYEIFNIQNGERVLIAKGKKEYSVDDIQIQKRHTRYGVNWRKTLPLEAGFVVGTGNYREKPLKGFGLWIRRNGKGFSWDWFNMVSSGQFKKLQEGGFVTVESQEHPYVDEVGTIRFNTDISLRLNESAEIGNVTKRVLIKKGSVLQFGP